MDITAVDTSTARLPSRYQAAKIALRDCSAVDECKEWADKASALASYAKQAGDTQLEEMAKRIRARAMRRAGELLKQVESAQGTNLPNVERAATGPIGKNAAAAEAGFSPRQAKTAQRIASVPEEDFEEMVETGATLTQIAQAGIQRPSAPVHDREEGKKLVAALKAHAERMAAINLDEAAASLDQVQVAQVRMLVARLDSYHDRVVTSV
jgi:hypothetical protein